VSHIRVITCQVDEPEQMTELAVFDVGGIESIRLDAAHTLDDLEARTHRVGHAILCRLLEAQWDLVDEQLTEQYVQAMVPMKVQRDSRERLKVASRFGVVQLARQICTQPDTQQHTIPGNAVLPAGRPGGHGR
jgi:hypothetical protein